MGKIKSEDIVTNQVIRNLKIYSHELSKLTLRLEEFAEKTGISIEEAYQEINKKLILENTEANQKKKNK
jgi:hypothetical protein